MIKNNIGKELSFETKLIIAKEKIKKTSKSLNSIIAYKKDWSHFEKWCVNNKQNLIPTEIDSVILYLTELADGIHGSLKTSTILRRISAIIYMNKENGHSFDLKNIGIQNSIDYVKTTLGEEQDRTPALLIEDLEKIVKEIDKEIIKNSNRLINYRDKAILLISWHGAYRRSELVNIKFHNVKDFNEGLSIKLDRSKSDKTGKNPPKPINRLKGDPNFKNFSCPCEAYDKWIEISKIADGNVFVQIDSSNKINHSNLSDKSIALIVKKWAEKANIDNDKLSGHSARAGFVTSMAERGATLTEIMKTTQHKSVEMPLRYYQDANFFNTAVKSRLKNKS